MKIIPRTLSLTSANIQDSDILKLLYNLPFSLPYLQEVNDETKVFKVDSSYLLSPLFVRSIQDSLPLTALTELAPYYTSDEPRNPGTLNVPRVLQNSYWETLFKEALGSLYNIVITDAYNALKYNYLSEERILLEGILEKLHSYGAYGSEEPISFEKNESLSSLEERISSLYSLLNYSPSHSNFIDDWLESLYVSGSLSDEDKLREELLYKVQDIKAELLRRKFAGSTGIYRILLSSINRKGTFAPTLSLADINNSSSFLDTRVVRALDIPGVTTEKSTISIDPISAFSPEIPTRILEPLYYSSKNYSTAAFENNPSNFLRNNVQVFAWDNIKGIIDTSSVVEKYDKLDESIELDNSQYLDDSSELFNLEYAANPFFDVQADRILYHKNTLQESLGSEYPFATYTISGGNSLSLMDTPWLDYIQNTLDNKTRVQEDVAMGVQVSRLSNIPANYVEENFTMITFSKDLTSEFSQQSSSYLAEHQYAYLWNIRMFYDRDTFEIKHLLTERNALTYIFLKNESGSSFPEKITSHPSFNIFTKYSSGLIPFSYSELDSSSILTMQSRLTQDEIVDDLLTEEYTRAMFFFTHKENAAISKQYLRTPLKTISSSSDPDWTPRPVSNESIKHIIFGVSRGDEWYWSEPIRLFSPSLLQMKYYHPDWMGMIFNINPYLNFTEASASVLRRKEVSPRALRPSIIGSDALEDPEPELGTQVGPSRDVSLTNLALSHGYHVYDNSGGDEQNTRGLFLKKVRPERLSEETLSEFLARETLQIWGDNRPSPGQFYANDPADDWESNIVRSQIYFDNNAVPAIKQSKGSNWSSSSQSDSYYVIQPTPLNSYSSNWVWDDDSNGMSVFFDLKLEDSDEMFSLLSRRGDLSKDVNAEFDLYFTADKKLVFEVYPEGSIHDSNIFKVELPADLLVEHQTQIAAGYSYEEDGDSLHISQTLVADRLIITKYYVVDKGETHYLIYEADSSFVRGDRLDGKPLDVASEVYPNHPEEFFYGKLIKRKDETNTSLGNLSFFNRKSADGTQDGYYSTLGTLYDFRLHNSGRNPLELLYICAGTKRELYSYSPALYKLLYQHFSDTGVMKRCNTATPETSSITSIRAFSRSVWDSILVDLYGTSVEESTQGHEREKHDYLDPLDDQDVFDSEGDYVEGVLEQLLVEGYESISPIEWNSTSVDYRGKSITLEGQYSLAQTSLYPLNYQKAPFSSGAILKKAGSVGGIDTYKAYFEDSSILPEGASLIELPLASSGDTLKYQADLDLNFQLEQKVVAASPYVYGTNITVSHDGSQFVIKHRAQSLSSSVGATQNFFVVPLYLPHQGEQENNPTWEANLTGVNLHHVSLAEGLSRMLNASSYYNELQIPYPYLNGSAVEYTSRWDAIRILKEGEYVVTCKYPVQITPINSLEASKYDRYSTLYATARFKVVVKGSPKYYEDSIDGLPNGWLQSELGSYLKNNIYHPTNNKDFPHREIKIDLFVQVEDEWVKKASNWDSQVTIISQDMVDNNRVVLDSIPLQFTEGFLSPAYVEEEGDLVTKYVSYKIKNSLGEEKLKVSNQQDLRDNPLTLLTGRSYRMILDYTPYVSELSRLNDYYSDTSVPAEDITSAEVASYSEADSLLRDFSLIMPRWAYSQVTNWNHITSNYDLTARSIGYEIDANNEFIAPSSNNLGNPYSRNLGENSLLSKIPQQRRAIEEQAIFTYRVDNPSVVVPPLYFNTSQVLPLVRKTGSNYFIVSNPDNKIMEFDIVKNWHGNLYQSVFESLSQLINKTPGVISSFHEISPMMNYRGSLVSVETITQDSHELIAYAPSALVIPKFNPCNISWKNTYGNNLVPNALFTNKTYYEGLNGSYQQDSIEGDSYTFSSPGSSKLVYKGVISGDHWLQLKVYASAAGSMVIRYKFMGRNLETLPITLDLGWNSISEKRILDFSATSIEFLFSVTGIVKLSRFSLRQANPIQNHIQGFSDIRGLSSQTPGQPLLTIPSASLVGFKRIDTGKLFPIQFLDSRSNPVTHDRDSKKANFLINYALASRDVNSEVSLIRPWKRLMRFNEGNTYATFYPYRKEVKGDSIVETLSGMPTSDVFEIPSGGIEYNLSKSALEINELKLSVSRFRELFDTNLSLASNAITINNEKISALANCAHPDRYKKETHSLVAITNIQFVHEDLNEVKLLYELEYLPIIYDEVSQHFSINTLIRID